VQSILHRSLQYVTNRQAVLLADAIFSRASVVPGILDAILICRDSAGDIKSAAQIKADCKRTGEEFLDVTHQIVQEAERQMCLNASSLNLWPASLGTGRTSLPALKITDPWPNKKKVLWIRFARAGTGDRDNSALLFDDNGDMLSRDEVQLDAEKTDAAVDRPVQAEMVITKEEFVSCLLSCPALSEPLRRMSSSDHSSTFQKPIKLDVRIEEAEAESEQFDFLTVQRGVLLEVWSHNRLRGDTFLGEAWMPSLESLAVPRELALPLQRKATGSRPDNYKDHATAEHPESVGGTLFLAAHWQLPAPKTVEPSTAAQAEEFRHTGHMRMMIRRVDQVHQLEERMGEHMTDAGIFIAAYVNNEITGKWYTEEGKSHPTPLFKSTASALTFAASQDPNDIGGAKVGTTGWNEQFDFTLRTGAFESRQESLRKSSAPGAKGAMAAQDLKHADLKVVFCGPSGRPDVQTGLVLQDMGSSHKIQVFLHDSIGDFLEKVSVACKQLAEQWRKNSGVQAQEVAKRYETASNTSQRVVMGFMPNAEHLKLMEPGWSVEEYRQILEQAHEDLTHWQPLDPFWTFDQYVAKFGFGGAQDEFPQLLRLVDASDNLHFDSHRYRRFLQEQQAHSARIEDLNEPNRCYAHALYRHLSDGGSAEWRPCMVRANQEDKGGKRKRSYKVSWAFTPSCVSATGLPRSPANPREDVLEEDAVLLAPAEPRILDTIDS